MEKCDNCNRELSVEYGEETCHDCFGYGTKELDVEVFVKCKTCKGTGEIEVSRYVCDLCD